MTQLYDGMIMEANRIKQAGKAQFWKNRGKNLSLSFSTATFKHLFRTTKRSATPLCNQKLPIVEKNLKSKMLKNEEILVKGVKPQSFTIVLDDHTIQLFKQAAEEQEKAYKLKQVSMEQLKTRVRL